MLSSFSPRAVPAAPHVSCSFFPEAAPAPHPHPPFGAAAPATSSTHPCQTKRKQTDLQNKLFEGARSWDTGAGVARHGAGVARAWPVTPGPYRRGGRGDRCGARGGGGWVEFARSKDRDATVRVIQIHSQCLAATVLRSSLPMCSKNAITFAGCVASTVGSSQCSVRN
eukprot:gene10897-biopygen22847